MNGKLKLSNLVGLKATRYTKFINATTPISLAGLT